MTPSQCRATAAGFLHLLKTTPDVYNEWLATPKDDSTAICALIGRTLGLAEAPTELDLETMAKYTDAALTSDIRELLESDDRTPRHVGIIYLVQHGADLRELVESDERTPRHVGVVFFVQHS